MIEKPARLTLVRRKTFGGEHRYWRIELYSQMRKDWEWIGAEETLHRAEIFLAERGFKTEEIQIVR